MTNTNYAGLHFTQNAGGVFTPNYTGFRSYGAFFRSGFLVPGSTPLTFGEKIVRSGGQLVLAGVLGTGASGCVGSGALRYTETDQSHVQVGATTGNNDLAAGRARTHLVTSPTESSGLTLDGSVDHSRQEENGTVSSGSGRLILSPYPLVATSTLRFAPSIRFGGGMDKRTDSERETLPSDRYTLSSGAGLTLDVFDERMARLTRAALSFDYNLGNIAYDLQRNGQGVLRGEHSSIAAALRVQQRLAHPDVYALLGSSVLLGNKGTDGTFHARSGPLRVGMDQDTLSYEATGGVLMIPVRYSSGWPLLFGQVEGGYGRSEAATTLTQSGRTSSSRDANGQAILRGRIGANMLSFGNHALYLFAEAERNFGLNGASDSWRVSSGLDLTGTLFTESERGRTLDSLMD